MDTQTETAVISITNDTYTKDTSPHSVSLNDTTYSLTLDVDPTGFTGTPKLVVSIPKGITLSSYPTSSNGTLASYINDVSVMTETDGSTTLTYIFNLGISTVGFNITLLPTYKLKTGSTYAVKASVYDGDTEKGTASDAITVAQNPTLTTGAYSCYVDEACQYVNRTTTDNYYVKALGKFYSNYPNHYDYDSLTITVPIPNNATPGYYEGNTFVELTENTSYAFTGGTATYKTDLTFTADNGTPTGSGNAVVYQLSSSHALTSTSNTSYMYNSNMGGIYLRFSGDTAVGIYTPGVSSKVVAQVDGNNYTLLDYAKYSDLSYYTVSYSFRNYDINDYVYPIMGTGYVSVYTDIYLMPQADNQYFCASLYNLTGNELTNVEVEYTGGYSGSDTIPLSADIHCYKLAFNLSSSGVNPSTADVTYSYYDASSKTVVTEGSAYLTASDSTLCLDEGDYFTEIHATYDHLGLSANAYSPINTLNAYCYNANNVNSGTCYIYSKIISATISSKNYSASDWTKTGFTYFNPCTTLSIYPYYTYLNGTSNGMDKGTQYSLCFYPASYGTVKNFCVYFLMPEGYELQSYVPPFAWGVTSSDYTISSRSVTVESETELGTAVSYKVPAGTYTLYTIQYADGADHVSNGAHIVYFTLGPTVDTAEVKNGIAVPSALCMTTDSTVYPFYSNNDYYQLTDALDFDSDGNTTETFARFSAPTTATQNAAKVISISGTLTSSYEGGSGTSKFYQYNSTGNYTFTVYNGLDSGNTAQATTISIAVPSTDMGISAKLTGRPVLSGKFLTGATATYSIDGGLSYVSESSVNDWSAVTNIKIVSASNVKLSSGEAAYVSVPFSASYGTSVSSASASIFSASMSYSLYKNDSLSSTPNTPAQDCTMQTAPVTVSGTVFKDYDSDGVRDNNEQNNGKYYPVTLYSGSYTSGVTGLTTISNSSTNSISGAFSFPNSIFQPGEYTLCVSLAGEEALNDYSTGWTLDNGYAYYPFTVGGSVTSVTKSLPLNAPRTLILNYTSCFLYDNAAKKLISTVLPALNSGETVNYESSDPSIVTVASDGTLTYVSEGTATITATAPGYNGGSDVKTTCSVSARKSAYSITLNAGNNVALNASGYTLSSGVYTGSYIPGNYIYLPASSVMTNSDAACYFAGWYDNAGFTGSPISYITAAEYGDKTYFAKWDRYEAAYETAADTWSYGMLSTAFSEVYNGGTIKLLRDVSLYYIPTITSNITLKTGGSACVLTINYYINVTTGSLTIDDDNLTITGSAYGYNYLVNLSGTGTMSVKAGTISSTSIYGIQNSGILTVSGGTVQCTNSSSFAQAVRNMDGGKVSITAGSVISASAASTASSSSIPAAVYNSGTGTVSITGGSITSSRTDGAAVCEDSSAAGKITVSGTPVITSASDYTIECLKHMEETAAVSYFGKTYYSSSMSNITLTGTDNGAGNHVINPDNYDGAIVSAKNIQSGYALTAWTSDSGHSSQLSTVNGAAVSSLKSADGSSFTTVYADFGLARYTVGGTISEGSSLLSDLSGITVTLYSSGSATTYTAQTNFSGSFTIPEVTVGSYTAVVEAVSGKYGDSQSSEFTLASADISDITILLEAPTFSISGTVDTGLTTLSDKSGIEVDLYYKNSQSCWTSYSSQNTDSNGAFQFSNVPQGTYMAVIEREETGKYARSKSAVFTLTDTDCSSLSITLSATIPSGYPVFVITKGTPPNSANYYVYEKKSANGGFEPFRDLNAVALDYAYSSIDEVMMDVSAESIGASPTLYFGASGTNADNISGSLDLGSECVYLGDGNTYTIKGSISSTADSSPVICLYDDTSLIIDGAYIDSACSGAVENDGKGSIRLVSGTVKTEGKNSFAIMSNNDHSAIDISGGVVSGKSAAVLGANVHISRGYIECAGGPALICLGGESTISGGNLIGNNSSASFDPESNAIPGTVLLYSECKSNKLIVSGGTIKNTALSGYAIYILNCQYDEGEVQTFGELRLSGHPSISGAEDIWTNTAIYANNGAVSDPAAYTGGPLSLYYGGDDLQIGTVVVRNVTKGTNDKKFDLANADYGLLRVNTDLAVAMAPGAPTGLSGIAPTSENGTNGSISGTKAAMEYKPVLGNVEYAACSDSGTTVGKAGNYLVRYAATDTLAASPAVTVNVPPYISHSVSGTVTGSTNSPVSGALVKVMQGGTQFGVTTTTNIDGKFTVSGIPDGEYNLVVTYGGRTVTQFITVSGTDCAAGTIVLPNDQRNSILDVQGSDTPAVVVNGLDDVAEAQAESSCTVTMTVEKKAADDTLIQDQASAIAIIAQDQTVEYLKIDVTKTTDGSSMPLDSLGNVQEIIIPYDFGGKKNITVYRYHGTLAAPLTSLSARPASLSGATDGTFYTDAAYGKIYIYTKEFSTYAIGYNASSASDKDSDASYKLISPSAGTGGSISPNYVTSVAYGGSKTYVITPEDGYYISDVIVDGKSVGAVSSYTFTSVTQAHTIQAAFLKISGLPYYLNGSGNKVFIGFSYDKSGTMKYIAPKGVTVQFAPNPKNYKDIADSWGKSYIDFATQREIFIGTAPNVFSPDTGMTRAMFATVIGRLYERSYGALTVSGTHAFTDCDYDDWYGSYIDWCAENGIIEGVGGGLYEPDREITREEMAAIIYRFAKFMGVFSADYANTQLAYPDTASVSAWATDAAKYCQQTGIIAGRDNGCFVPQGTATRAEVAAILERFIEIIV